MSAPENIVIKNKISSHEFLKVEPFDVSKRYTKPHKHNKYLELVFFTQGSGQHYLDLKAFEIKPPVTFLIHKDQVHHWNINTIPEGYVIIIKQSFLEHILDTSIQVDLNKLKDLEKIDISNNDNVLPLLFKALCLEMKQNKANTEVIESTLKAILAKLIYYANHKTFTNNQGLEQQFLQLLTATLKNSVNYYAKKLNTSPQNLNAVCKKAFEKSASDIIAEFITKEIKRQLVYTSKNVSDIAFDLGFNDTSNFTKFFKRHTNLTPLQFKKESF
ncbi:AraC family transcriptional regulator [Tamlana sedimentorum]|uniref:AraC family transcriptional regulator n=1 Tax=Neotamlana sedimentorum TaxID=1435349 RepID=A0A0D7W0P3_9FLAO|nr:helix-turn-helix transcriptional regulator [Tamlana sedimentorum]KJD32661.1 AraC family transcriptional regulator [Tamlana sedimentorum]